MRSTAGPAFSSMVAAREAHVIDNELEPG